jgi:GNAT superfamily N-acetyltransferase
MTTELRNLQLEDIQIIVEAFQKANWSKPLSTFETYLVEQQAEERKVWVAHYEKQFAGYITLKWQSKYESFRKQNIPEIMDLNVLPTFRNKGIGSKLLQAAEKEAANRSDVVGIGVGLYGGENGGYGVAQKLYIRHGYILDGKGVTYKYQPSIPGNNYPLDDDLIIWFTKKLNSLSASS